MKIKQTIIKSILLVSSVFFFGACTENSSDVGPTTSTPERYAVFITTDEATSSGILVPFDKMPSGDIDVSKLTNVVQLGQTRAAGVAFNGAIYHTGNTAGQFGIQKFTLNAAGTFVAGGYLPTGGQYAAGNAFGFATNTKGYYSNDDLSQTALQIFNPETMARTGQIDFSSQMNAIKSGLTGVVSTKIGGFMIVRDGKFFTQLFFLGSDGNHVPDKSYVAVVDVATDKLEKVITFDDYKLLGYGLKNCNYVNIDSNNDLYLGGFVGNFNDKEGPNFRVYRIKSGQTEFDNTWSINSLTDFTTENMGLGGQILNGKMYMKMFSTRIDITFAGMRGKTYDNYELDLATKKLKKITDIPSAYWKSVHGPAIYNNKPYFVVEDQEAAEQTANGKKTYYYAYDPTTGKSEKAITVIGGQPQQIIKF